MYKNFNLTESEREEILNGHMQYGYKQPLNEDSFYDEALASGTVGKDLVQLPPNDLFDPNVYGSYHYYKTIKGNFFNPGMNYPVAYYKLSDKSIFDRIKQASDVWKQKYPKASYINSGHWHFSKTNPGTIDLFHWRLQDSNKEGVIGSIPTPKGIGPNQTYFEPVGWAFENDGNIYLQFYIQKEQRDAYVKLMEEVVKIKDIPDPDAKKQKAAPQPTDTQQPINEAKETLKKIFNKFVK